jgi:alpha-L-rhamnosidase
MYNFNMASFYTKWAVDLAGTQGPTGSLCTVAPSTGYDQNVSTAWPAAIVFVPWDLYRFYGDTRPMADNYTVMQRFAESSLLRQVEGKPEIIREVLGDWLAPLTPSMTINDTIRNNTMAPPEGLQLYGTASHFLVVKRLSEISDALGRSKEEVTKLQQWAVRIAAAFNKEFFDAGKGLYHGDKPADYRQSANIVPLQYGITAEKHQKTVFENLLKDIRHKGDRLSTGFLGTPALMDYLATADPELAYKIATQPQYPGWGYMIAQGANAMWESWDGYDSRNHTPFCLISGYFYKYLAGIQPDVRNPGFKHIIINPSIINDLTYVDAYHDCIYGRIKSSWKRDKNQLTMEITIPANTTATLHIPATSVKSITESGLPVDKAQGLKLIRMENGKAILNVGSGNYRFEIKISFVFT